MNAKQRDKIPSPAFIDRRSDAIVNYWDHMYEVYPRRFSREINIALTGSPEKMSGWQDAARERLAKKNISLRSGGSMHGAGEMPVLQSR